MMYIPQEIAEEILLRLPVKSLLRFRCVCKSWYKFLKHNTVFVKNHLKHAKEKNSSKLLFTCHVSDLLSIDYDHSSPNKIIQNRIHYPFKSSYHIESLGSCNGLFFIKRTCGYVTGLWNPATKEYKIIPWSHIKFEWKDYNVPLLLERHGYVINCGFGYDRLSDEYKLVTLLSPFHADLMVSQVQVYTVSSNSLKQIEYIPYKIGDRATGVFVHEALHWLAKPCPKRSNNQFSQVLLSFNMAEEVFNELPLPEIFHDSKKFKSKCIDVLEGRLCMLCSHSKVGIEVWVMNEYGVGDSWMKRYDISRLKLDSVIPSFQYLRRIHSLKSGEILLEIKICSYVALVFYDPKHERTWVGEIDLGSYGRRPKKVSTSRLPSKLLYTVSYVESLVSLQPDT